MSKEQDIAVKEEASQEPICHAPVPKGWWQANYGWVIWVVSVLFACGVYAATVWGLKDDMTEVKASLKDQDKRAGVIEQKLSSIAIDQGYMQKDITVIKTVLMDNGNPKMVSYMPNLDDVIASACKED